jgi:hypothetical protein
MAADRGMRSNLSGAERGHDMGVQKRSVGDPQSHDAAASLVEIGKRHGIPPLLGYRNASADTYRPLDSLDHASG